MSKIINVRTPSQLKAAYKKIAKGMGRPFKSIRRMFMQLGVMIDTDTMLTFKKEGGYLTRTPWQGYAKSTMEKLKTYPELGKIRYGTDLRGRPGMQGKFRGKSIRRYDDKSKLLQTSGSFRDSFRIIKIGVKKMRYGTTHNLAQNIMSNPARPVLQYTTSDQGRYAKTILGWWFKNTKI